MTDKDTIRGFYEDLSCILDKGYLDTGEELVDVLETLPEETENYLLDYDKADWRHVETSSEIQMVIADRMLEKNYDDELEYLKDNFCEIMEVARSKQNNSNYYKPGEIFQSARLLTRLPEDLGIEPDQELTSPIKMVSPENNSSYESEIMEFAGSIAEELRLNNSESKHQPEKTV